MDVHNTNNINHYVFKVPIVHNTIKYSLKGLNLKYLKANEPTIV